MHGFDNVTNRAGEDFRRGNWSRAVRTHSTGVGADIAIVGPFVILTRRQTDETRAIHNDEHARFLTF